ncbi:MAG: hypothetical protein GX447_09370 [Elusimicrobia bacterium]|nr:hypothetical protein [Elusimicrobiota bacterium]
MKKIILICLFFIPFSVQAESELSFNLGLGEDSYKNYSFELKYSSENYYISPGFETYESDYLYKKSVYSLNFGGSFEKYDLDFYISLSPEIDGYKNYSAGADLYYSVYDGEDFFIKPGVFLSTTWHSDIYSSTSAVFYGGKNKTSYSVRTTPLELKETEYGVSLKAGGNIISGEIYYSKTSYDREISLTDRNIQSMVSEASFVAESGFSDYSLGADISSELGYGFSADMGYVYRTYLLGEKPSKTYKISFSKNFGSAEPNLSYEYSDDSAGGSSFFGFGLRVKI